MTPLIRAKTNAEYQQQTIASHADAVWLNMRGPQPEKSSRVARHVLSNINLGSGQSLIDVGCGDASLIMLTPPAVRSVGVLPTVEEVERLKALHPHLDIKLGTAQEIPQGDRLFDRVICNSVFLLFLPQDAAKAVSELARVAKPSGLVYIGEVPEVPYHGHDHTTPYRWLKSLLQTGLYHFGAGLKDLIKASITSSTLIFHPDPTYFSLPSDFIALAESHGLHEVWHARHPFDTERWDYIFRKAE